jgi:putative tricarboxylic transport membrane protein
MLVLSVIFGGLSLGVEDAFFSDPIGSAIWVQGIAVCLIFLSILLFFSKLEFTGKFPESREWANSLPFIFSIVVYSFILPNIGFFIATPLLITSIGIIFNARVVPAIISSIIMTIVCYLIFDVVLDISLPIGYYFK